jgi:hypothetical protein
VELTATSRASRKSSVEPSSAVFSSHLVFLDYRIQGQLAFLPSSNHEPLSSFLQKPVDDAPRVRFVPALGWRAYRRLRRLLRLRLVLRTGRFRRARWRGRVSDRPASFGNLQGCLSESAS